MTRVEWIEQTNTSEGLKLGMLSPALFAKFIVFKVYLRYVEAGNAHMNSIELAAEELKIPDSTAYKAVSFFVKRSGNRLTYL